jgi:hypothetical protein
MLKEHLVSRIKLKDLTEKRIVCFLEKKKDFEQTLISNGFSFAWIISLIS